MTWAVCYITQDSPFHKWIVVTAGSARVAAEGVRKMYSLCSIKAVYKAVEEWRWQ